MNRKIIGILLLLFAQGAYSQQQSARASIEGVVLRVDSNDPIAGIKITLSRSTPEGGTISGSSAEADPFVISDTQGRFAFRDIAAGYFRLAASRNGYMSQKLGQRGSAGTGTVLKLDSGQTVKNVAFHLTPQANVSGHIRNDGGEPLEGVTVQLQRYIYTPDGRRILNTVKTTTTNDRGEYRLYWIDPGRYYLAATGKDNFMSPRFKVGDMSYTPTYYGGVVDARQAAVIQLHPGDDTPAVDVVLSQQQNHVFRISGRVIDASGQPPKFARVAVTRRDSKGQFYGERRNTYYDNVKGIFEIGDLGPGTYWVAAQALESSSGTGGTAYIGSYTGAMFEPDPNGNPLRSAQVKVELNDTDIDNLVLNTSLGIPISGHLTIEGQSLAAFPAVQVELRGNPAATAPSEYAAVDRNGNFTVRLVSTGEYRIIIQGMTADSYVKVARLGADDIRGRTFPINGSTKASLEVVLSLSPGRIEGTVFDDSFHPVSGIQAVLVPDQQRDRLDLYKSVVADSNGKFVMREVVPGDYHLYSWEEIEPYSYFDSDVVHDYEPRGKVVHIVEAAKESVDIQMIPATQ